MAAKNRSKQSSSSKGSITTQKDGRVFAVAVLGRLQNADGDGATVYPYATVYDHREEVGDPYRTGPQWDGFYRDLSRLIRDGNDEAIKGFASIFTDALANDISIDLDVYRELERAGRFQDFGTPGNSYPAPLILTAKQTTAKKRREEKRKAVYLEEYDRAQKPNKTMIDRREPEMIEQFLKENGPTRRGATAFLTKPYDETAAEALKDRKTAETFAAWAVAIEESQENYITIRAYMGQALRNMKAAVRARKDGEKLLQAARQQ